MINSAGVGTLAMMGRETIRVRRPLTIGLIVTGDELVTDSATSSQPFIHNSNLPMLSSAIAAAGAIPVERSCGDDPAVFRQIVDELRDSVDLIITTGGISAGAFEVVRQELGDDHSTFLRLSMRPGGPQGHGRIAGVPLLHFPGTPTGPFCPSTSLHVRSSLRGPRIEVEEGRVHRSRNHGPQHSGQPGAGSSHRWGEIAPFERSRLRDFAGAEVIIRVPRAPGIIRPGDVIRVLDC